MQVDGTVTSGLGEGAGFASLSWVVEQVVAKLGYVPFPGTFNLRMHGEAWQLARGRMERATGIGIDPPEGYCRAKCFAVDLPGGLPAAAVLPEVDGYPADKLELLAAVSVRRHLTLRDGDSLRLTLVME
jgi:riboflavin kinase